MVYKESEVYMYDSEDGFPGKDSNRVQDEHFGSQCVKLSEFVNRSKIPSLLRNYADMLTGRLQESSQNTEYSHRAEMISLNQGHGGAPSVYSNPFPGCIFREARPFSKGEEDENTPSVIFYLDTTDSHGKTTTVNIRLSFAPCAPEESQAVTITIFYPESNQKIKEFTNVTDFINFISKKTSQEENIESACFL